MYYIVLYCRGLDSSVLYYSVLYIRVLYYIVV